MHIPKRTARTSKKVGLMGLVGVLGVASVFVALPVGQASASTLTNVMVRFDRMQTSQATTGTVCAKTATVGTESQVQVTFPTGYTLGASGTFTVTTTNLSWPSGAVAWPSITNATGVAGQVVTFTSGDLTASTLYCFNWNNSAAVQVKSSASSNTGTVNTNIDTATTYTTQSLTSDQISVSGSVAQTFSFALANTTDALGALSTGVNSSPTPATVTVNTNAASGWLVWAQDANSGLKSNATSHTIAGLPTAGSASTATAGTEGTNLGVTSTQTGGSGTISLGNYDGAIANHGSSLDTTLRTIASSNGTANGAVLTLKNNVVVTATTQAASDYADTITVVGAGMF